jgi:hypothetical protein
MSRSFLKFQEITKDTLLQLSPTAVVWAAAVVVFGTRLRGLPWIAVAHAAALGIDFAGWIWLSTLRAFYPPRRLWRPVFDLLDATGGWTAWAAALCGVISVIVTSRIAKILPPRSPAAAARSASRWARVRGFLGNFSPTDWRLGRWALVLSLTLIVPWMMGRFIFQDHLWLTTGPGVFDTSARTFWSHAPLLWGAGVLVILLALSAAWIFNPKWRGRYIAVISGILIGSITLVGVGPIIHNPWLTAERETAARLVKTPYPFSDHYYTCGSKSTTIKDGLWQVYTTQIAGSKTSNCNRLVFYKGWREMGHYDVRRGREVNTSPSIIARKTDPVSAVVKIKDTEGKTITVVLGKYI